MGSINISIIIPAYNEESSLESTTREVGNYLSQRGLSYEILIVDDGSTDSSLAVARRIEADRYNVRTITYIPNRGKGHAVRTGVLAAKGEKVLFTDSDNATPIDELPALMAALDSGCSVAIASRAVKGAVRLVHQPFYREIGGKILNLIIRTFAVRGIHDTQCGFKLFTQEAAEAIFSKCIIDGWSFDVEVLYLANLLGYKIAEMPVHWTHRGNSKVHPIRDGLKMLLDIVRIRTHRYQLPETGVIG